MSRLVLFILLFAFGVNYSVFAKGVVATAILVRGEVTQLRPLALSASKVQMGEHLLEDASIVTGKNSFIKLEFIDKSTVSLGPESKMVIAQIRPEGASVIALLKGSIRTKVRERTKDEKKSSVMVSTRTAALGVRGTEFETIYNPENRATALVTYKGKVAMVKMSDLDKIHLSEVETSASRLSVALENKRIVEVLPGQYAGTTPSLPVPTQPIVISPTQINAMYNNDKLTLDSSSKSSIQTQPQLVPPEGIMDTKQNLFASKAGGYIDLKSAVYIPPEATAKFDQQNNLYIPEKIGKINEASGEFVPPEGVVIDATKGLVAINSVGSTHLSTLGVSYSDAFGIYKAPTYTALRKNLSFKPLSKSEIQSKQRVEVEVSVGSEEFQLTSEGESQQFASTAYSNMKVTLEHATGSAYKLLTAMNIKEVGYLNEGSHNNISITTGVKRVLTARSTLSLLFALNQNDYYDRVEPFQMVLYRAGAEFEGSLFRYRRLVLDGRFLASITLPKEKANYKFSAGYAGEGELLLNIYLKQSWSVGTGMFIKKDSVDFIAQEKSFRSDRTENGILFKSQFLF